VEFFRGRGFLQELANLPEIQSTSNGGSVILANHARDKLPEEIGALVATVLAGRIHCNTSSLATLDGRDIVATTHTLPSGEKLTLLVTLGADESIEQLFRIVLVDTDAGAMVPVLTTTVTVDHHTMIIRATADAVFSTIVAFGVGRSRIHLTGWLTGALGVRCAGFLCCYKVRTAVSRG
jgi:hypothetical protein